MRILFITSELSGGGIENILLAYTNILTKSIRIDFVISSSSKGMLEDRVEKLGCSIFRIPKIKDGIKKRNNELRKILKENNYDIVHDNSGYKAYFSLKIAKECNVKVRIAHSHTSFPPESIKDKIMRKLTTHLTKKYATCLFSCGEQAGKWAWGKRCFEKGKVFIMKNGIDCHSFLYNVEFRNEIRKEFGIDDKTILIGNIARFSYEKNHSFLLTIFNDINKNMPNTKLLLVGDGELIQQIKKKAKELSLCNNILFAGLRNDIFKFYSAFDVFVLPSKHEGLPVTTIEAQANGLPVVCSDVITKEIVVNNNVVFLSLNQNLNDWVSSIRNVYAKRESVDVFTFPYDIQRASSDLLKKYNDLIGRNK